MDTGETTVTFIHPSSPPCATCGLTGHGCPASAGDRRTPAARGERPPGPAVYLGPVEGA